ncbi:HIT domain-containing protein [Candidatus Pacearchaeota archaeon]|nr:HIT domain-containing protein [Candidatus Pacearchaeota archaeon]
MPITTEEANKIKEHLLTQLDNFPEDKREQIAEQINSMSDEQIEAFVKQNKLTHLGGQCIFCSIIANKTKSYKIAEDKDNIAILELMPISKGHSLIVPKEHLEKTSESTNSLVQEVSKKLKKKFSPQEIKINEIKIMGHALLEIIPIYGDETEKRQASEEELKSLQEEILKPSEIKIEKPQEIKIEEIPILPPRIP